MVDYSISNDMESMLVLKPLTIKSEHPEMTYEEVLSPPSSSNVDFSISNGMESMLVLKPLTIKSEPAEMTYEEVLSPPLSPKPCHVLLERLTARDLTFLYAGVSPSILTSVRGRQWPCPFCSYVSTAACTTTRHVTRRHTREYHFFCDICNKKFQFRYECLQHKRSRHRAAEEMFPCSHCSRLLKSKEGLRIHEATHTGQKDYACGFCDKTFNSNYALKVHTRHHTGDRPYFCQFCSYRAHSHAAITSHVRIHTSELPYACSYCPRRFSLNGSRFAHERRIHTGERPFVCSVCDSDFASKSDLNAHQWLHREGHEAPFQCLKCKRGFGRKDTFEKHARSCDPSICIRCEYCDQAFRTQLSLSKHRRVHEIKEVIEPE